MASCRISTPPVRVVVAQWQSTRLPNGVRGFDPFQPHLGPLAQRESDCLTNSRSGFDSLLAYKRADAPWRNLWGSVPSGRAMFRKRPVPPGPGAIGQLAAHLVLSEEIRGSNPRSSTEGCWLTRMPLKETTPFGAAKISRGFGPTCTYSPTGRGVRLRPGKWGFESL